MSSRSKICLHSNNNRRVVIFYPARSPDPDSPAYHEYCMYALIKWKPWVGNRINAWGGIQRPSQAHLCAEWAAHARTLLASGVDLPDSFHRDVRFAAREIARLAREEGLDSGN